MFGVYVQSPAAEQVTVPLVGWVRTVNVSEAPSGSLPVRLKLLATSWGVVMDASSAVGGWLSTTIESPPIAAALDVAGFVARTFIQLGKLVYSSCQQHTSSSSVIPAESPADVTVEMANEYKRRRMEATPAPSPWSIRGDLATLKAVFGKWLGSECGLLAANPFANVKPPKCDEPDVRIVTAEETDALFAWLEKRWNKWRLPAVYLEVAARVKAARTLEREPPWGSP